VDETFLLFTEAKSKKKSCCVCVCVKKISNRFGFFPFSSQSKIESEKKIIHSHIYESKNLANQFREGNAFFVYQ